MLLSMRISYSRSSLALSFAGKPSTSELPVISCHRSPLSDGCGGPMGEGEAGHKVGGMGSVVNHFAGAWPLQRYVSPEFFHVSHTTGPLPNFLFGSGWPRCAGLLSAGHVV